MEKEGKRQIFCGWFLTWVELQSLVASDLKIIKSFALGNAMMQRIEKTAAKNTGLGFIVTDTGVKYAIFRFVEKASTDKEKQRFTYEVSHTCF